MKLKNKISFTVPAGIGPVLRGLLTAIVLMIGLALILGLIFYLTPLSETWMPPLGVVTITLSLFFGGRRAAKAAGKKGLYHGLMVGVLFIILMALMSSVKEISWSGLAVKSAYALIGSAIGGISGIK